MKLALGQITEVVGPMAKEGVVATVEVEVEVAATVEVEVADSEEADREDIKFPLLHFLLNKCPITTGSYNISEPLLIFARGSFLANALLSGFQTRKKRPSKTAPEMVRP